MGVGAFLTGYIFFIILIYLGAGLGFGFGTRAIATSKGYSESWFWFGFFCWAVGLIVAACMQPTAREMGRRMERYGGAYGSYNANTPGSWRCVCGQINQSYTGTCSCGRAKPAGASLPVVSSQYVSTDSQYWICPNCQTRNARFVTSCSCGCSIDRALEREKMLKDKQKEIELARMQEKKEKEEELKRKQEEFIRQFDGFDLSNSEKMVIRMLSGKEDRLKLSAMCQRIPRSADIQEFKDAVNRLEESHLIAKDIEDRYYITLRADEVDPDDVHTEEIVAVDVSEAEIAQAAGGDGTAVSDKEAAISDAEPKSSGAETMATPQSADKYEEIRNYKKLLDEGILTEEEFNQKKKELLGL